MGSEALFPPHLTRDGFENCVENILRDGRVGKGSSFRPFLLPTLENSVAANRGKGLFLMKNYQK